MGFLDSITSALGNGNQGLKEQTLKSMLENVLGKNADYSSLFKNFDMSKAGDLINFFQKNGLPDTQEEIQELISKFTKATAKK